MTTPSYKGSGQPAPSSPDGVLGWFGGLLGGGANPVYKTAVPPPPAPTPTPCPPCLPCPPTLPCPPCPPAPPCPPVPVQKPCAEMAPWPCESDDNVLPLDGGCDAVIPVGNGPITIVIQPRC